MFLSATKLLKINEMHNFLSIILINYLGDFQFRQQVEDNNGGKKKVDEILDVEFLLNKKEDYVSLILTKV